jgi:hypothetical protein
VAPVLLGTLYYWSQSRQRTSADIFKGFTAVCTAMPILQPCFLLQSLLANGLLLHFLPRAKMQRRIFEIPGRSPSLSWDIDSVIEFLKIEFSLNQVNQRQFLEASLPVPSRSVLDSSLKHRQMLLLSSLPVRITCLPQCVPVNTPKKISYWDQIYWSDLVWPFYSFRHLQITQLAL